LSIESQLDILRDNLTQRVDTYELAKVCKTIRDMSPESNTCTISLAVGCANGQIAMLLYIEKHATPEMIPEIRKRKIQGAYHYVQRIVHEKRDRAEAEKIE
jgi:hypothetical protein